MNLLAALRRGQLAAGALLLTATVLLLTPTLYADKPSYSPRRTQTKDLKSKTQLKKEEGTNEKYLRELAEMFLEAIVQRDPIAVRANLSKSLRQAIEETGRRSVAQWAAQTWPSSNLTGFEITSERYDIERDDALYKGAFLGEVNGRTVRYPFTVRLIREEQDAPYRVDLYRVDGR